MERKCGNCLIWKQYNKVCPFFKEEMKEDSPACPKFTDIVKTCACCGNSIIGKPYLASNNDMWYELCADCDEQWGNCATCANITSCDYETNPINLPKQIPTQTRKGPMVINTVGRNPARIKETCAKGCSCWQNEECWRNTYNGLGCNNWRPRV